MTNFLMILLWIVSVLIIGAVLMQPSKNNDAMSSFTGGASDLFSESKSRGFESFIQRVTVVLGILFFGIALILMWMSQH
ncbi:preprotein translocase subunit SecG [Fructilactobacillus lindneri]|uniref:Protein-export membrane protein SecG n=1 Tax=Fructilactobacillus lindneri TaxID=53444 RepID=A0AB33BSA2_9LACO|nr:preprotein translocase subunit SecG [Fructilactobacillus lindneri]ANZ58443.1 preprotein translocase subunit SecG [Fructilactobacillus lindneri]ANZ59753.1 preprotein translocase subunit SecG [Fructilactobacillus lindneri]POG98452.1 preprotein translocase subunit SecG [Fructilactobacillus lindneri]POH03852.1 preprotein translocase subunit SecG [Fructilactobacillus lindneri]POH04904.1 preprotein translocase subunit SecG [Fructilactobacillus lindneri]